MTRSVRNCNELDELRHRSISCRSNREKRPASMTVSASESFREFSHYARKALKDS